MDRARERGQKQKEKAIVREFEIEFIQIKFTVRKWARTLRPSPYRAEERICVQIEMEDTTD